MLLLKLSRTIAYSLKRYECRRHWTTLGSSSKLRLVTWLKKKAAWLRGIRRLFSLRFEGKRGMRISLHSMCYICIKFQGLYYLFGLSSIPYNVTLNIQVGCNFSLNIYLSWKKEWSKPLLHAYLKLFQGFCWLGTTRYRNHYRLNRHHGRLEHLKKCINIPSV